MYQAKLFEHLSQHKKANFDILLCEEYNEAVACSDVCSYFGYETLLLPDFRATYLDDLKSFQEEMYSLLGALRVYHSASKKPIVIATCKTLLYPFPKASLLTPFEISFAQSVDLKAFKEQLLQWGYTFVDMIEVESEVSVRGDIIDIYPPRAKNPFRISMFDDTIEQIKEFDITSQRSSSDEIESLTISPAFFNLSKESYERVASCVENSQSDSFIKDIATLGFWYLEDEAEPFLQNRRIMFYKDMEYELDTAYEDLRYKVPRELFVGETLKESESVKDLVVADVSTLINIHKKRKISIIASNDTQLQAAGIFDTTALHVIKKPYIVNVISDTELVISLNKTKKVARKRRSSILVDDLKRGDYVVHEEYGVGIFESITQAQILGGMKDFLVIKYQGDDKVLLPVENLNVIDRYIASGGVPTLDKLGKGSFAKLKDKVKKRLFEIAGDIVNTAASRSLIKADVIKVDKRELKEFQAHSGFDYTLDQEVCINDIIEQLSSANIMDRLLSGDVGFGKTEVAMNAIYATARSGFQSAIVVPTTLLSSQHFKSLKERFEEFDIKVAKLDRFVSTSDKKRVLTSLKEGAIDCVVGTHALFGVEFKKLGLVIIDEEHKFGVKQKEKLKAMHERVHLLSMSATPIPRSLNQALSSIKQLSTLTTPPTERQGVRTFVKAYDEKLIKEVILRELRRGGQIFYVHNSIANMSLKYAELKELMPNLRILMLHSKISAAVSEKELMKFQKREYDLLLATSIIEAGIHMPNVNTMLIDGANNFGMADLHQLRGRVGRGKNEGFAYFIVENKDTLSDEAKKRLSVLESNSFLGAGAVLAYHDLEIRGGGNLIGDSQSGHIKNIGYSLYLRMLEDAIKELSNSVETTKQKVDLTLSISAYISDEVVSEDRLRLELYRRLSHCEEASEIYEIEEEVVERFGELDAPTKQFFELMIIKLLALEKNIIKVSNYAQNITFEYQSNKKEVVKSSSKDDDDIIKAVLYYLRNNKAPLSA
ncbi:MAG: transcription-repair coupling factor [Campylobacterota bacterium]|nr:transcription-repair coupling factor [Campylobacterota bacterium]